MKSLSVIKNSCLLAGIILTTDMCAMEQAIVLREKHRQTYCISRKESKFDFMNVRELNNWYWGLSDEQKKAIVDNLNDKDEIGKGRLMLFNFITQPSEDVQRVIVSHILKKFKNNTQAAAEFCENIPLCNAFNTYQFSKKAFKEKDNFNEYLADDPSFKRDTLFKHAKDILIFDKYSKDMSCCLGKNELKSIHKVCKEFKGVRGEVNYKFYESFTIDNFKNSFTREQWCALPLFLAPFVSKLIAKEYTYKCFNQTIADSNRERAFVKPFFEKEHQGTGDSFWLTRIQPIRDPFEEQIDYRIASIKSLVYGSTMLLGISIGDGISSVMRSVKDATLFDITIFIGGSCVIGLASLGVKEVIAGLFPQLMEPLLDRPLLGITCVTGLYALIVALYNIKQMRTSRVETTRLKNLSDLLKRTDIVIE